MSTHWTDLVDPARDAVVQATEALHVDPATIDRLAATASGERPPLPLLEAHSGCILAVLAYPVSTQGRADYLELDVLASPDAVVTVRKAGASGALAPVDGVAARADGDAPVGALVHAAIDDAADAFLVLVDDIFASIDDLEDEIEQLSGADVRRRIAAVRNELLRARRVSSMTRTVARRILDGRVDIGRSELFPAEIENTFVDTYETLVRVTEELDVARDLLGGVRDYYQATIAEQQNEVAKTLTVIASLVLVPSLIVGFYGQNFARHFGDWYWTFGVSLGLIAATTVIQLALFRQRRWL
ncbi:magnesium transporter CorA family protein [Gaiella sp.]|uniref:magnesium transporter CorA family protein n=1 Tax=Gaiella sp. TaxID=2663207 RepID=UPI002E359845|nr:CorA family divalent cation transporter [Gaiella sp.]HEX5583089.1 CorA family divalent cation transporter [Gaiella sp.]